MSITPEVLQQVAERLGWDALTQGPTDPMGRVIFGKVDRYQLDPMTDGDLLLAILNRAAEMPDDDGENLMAVMHGLLTAAEEQPRPEFLEAAILAFIQLPVAP